MRRAFVFGAEKSARHLIGAIVFGCLGGAAAISCSSSSTPRSNCNAITGCGMLPQDGGDDVSDATVTIDQYVAPTPDGTADGTGDATGDVKADSPLEATADVSADAPGEAGPDGGADGGADAPSDVASDVCLQTSCSNGVCTNLNTDPNNCGACGNACGMSGTCSGGTCVCSGSATSCLTAASSTRTHCVDLASDTNNCGACLHDCQGSTCSASLCVPSLVATAGGLLQQIAVDGINVFWTQSGSNPGVYTQPIAGGSAITVSTDPAPQALTTHAGSLYWADYATGAILTVDETSAIAGMSASATSTVVQPFADAGSQQLSSLAVDDNNIYWTAAGTGTVYMAPLAGSNKGNAVPLATGQNRPNSIAVDSTYAYWVNQGTSGSTGSVVRAPIDPDAGGWTPIASGQPAPLYTIALDSNYIYWTSTGNGNGSVSALAKNAALGTTPTVIAANQQSPYGIVVDPTLHYVYWTNATNNTVDKALFPSGDAGTSVVLVASGLTYVNVPKPMALDPSAPNVLWGNFGNGQIMKVSK